MFLSTWQPQPILLSVGTFQVYWYGLLLAVGAVVGLVLVLRLGRRYGFSSAAVTDLFVWLVIGGFVGGRLYHVTNEWAYYQAHPTEIWQVWNGGLAIHGAMIVGLFIIWLFARRQKVNAWLLSDILVVGLAAGQAIGRWGNYFNQELFGRPTDLPWKIIIDEAHRPNGYSGIEFFHPTFLYESIGSALICAGLFFIAWKRRSATPPAWIKFWAAPGSVALTYFITYSLVRIATESLRIDRVPLVLGVRLPLLTSLIIIAVALALWLLRSIRHPHARPS